MFPSKQFALGQSDIKVAFFCGNRHLSFGENVANRPAIIKQDKMYILTEVSDVYLPGYLYQISA